MTEQAFAVVPVADLKRLEAKLDALSAQLQAIQPAPEWLTVSEAAEALGVSTDTVRRRVADGTLEARGAGKLRRVRL